MIHPVRLLQRLPRLAAGRCCALARDRRGATAFEFALSASAFMGLLIGTLQIAIVFFVQQGVQTAAEVVARRVLTGQIPAGTTQEKFRTDACAQLPSYLKCANLYVDVRKAAGGEFGNLDTSVTQLTYDASGNVNNNWSYDTGSGGDVMILRLIYKWPISTAPLGFSIGNQSDGSRLVIGTMVFKSERY